MPQGVFPYGSIRVWISTPVRVEELVEGVSGCLPQAQVRSFVPFFAAAAPGVAEVAGKSRCRFDLRACNGSRMGIPITAFWVF